METAREILQFLHYHPSSPREEIRIGIGFQESDATLKRLIAAGVEAGDIDVEGKARAILNICKRNSQFESKKFSK